MALGQLLKRLLLPKTVKEKLDRIDKPVGTLGFDPWGFHTDTNKTVIGIYSYVYNNYFRVQTHGIEHIPADGPVLIVANHSGQLPIDGTLIAYALATRDLNPRMPRAMIERFFPTVPYLGNLLNEIGAVLGDPVNCAKMLSRDEAIIIFPEGVRGSGKLYRDRYQLKRFGNGFMHLAMQYNAPIIPVGVVGCEETIPAIANIKPLARALGIPYAPIALPVIFPAKVHLNFGKPMVFSGAETTEEEVAKRVETVKAEINRLIDKGLSERKGIF